MATNITASLNYGVMRYDRPYFYAREKLDDKERPHQPGRYSGENKSVDVAIQDGRGLGLTLDGNSFELVSHETSLKTDDFYNKESVTSVYYEEMKQLLMKETGASHVQLFHHQVRNAVKNNSENGNINTSVQGYAHKIHSDSSMFSAEELFRTMVTTTPEPEKYCKGRFMYVNVWRSIGDEPIEDNHLAMCDEMSVVKPDDYIYTELHGEGYDILQYYLNASNSHLHRWYYFPQMTKNEAIIFKQWDSDTTKPSRLCFHTAFEDPSAPKDASVRQSIEVRAIVYFPDHAPNTCPEVDTSVDEVTGDQTVDAGVHKILKVVGNINSWPVAALFWIRYNLSRGKTGVKAIAMTLAKDKHGYFGLKSLPKETQEEIATTLMTKTNFEGILRGSFEKVKHRASLKNLNLNFNIYTATFVTALSLAVGWGLCRFLK